MKNFSGLVIALLLFGLNARAQFYTQGDVSVIQMPSTTHDSTICATVGQMMYQITVQNSFTGDDVVIKDEDWGNVLFQTTNATGQNPWVIMQPLDIAFNVIPDWQIVGGYANFWGPNTKVISGTDTIHNIMNMYSAFVPNPCTYGTVAGAVYVDNNSDCAFNAGDVPLSGIPVSGNATLNSPTQSTMNANGYSDGSGAYTMNIQESWLVDYTVSIPAYYQFIFPPSACAPSYYFTTVPQNNVDFPLQCTSNVDVQCYAGTPGAVRPGIPFYLSPIVNNTGCDAASGTLTLVLDPNVIYDAALSTYPADAVNGDTLTWNYANLSNLSTGMYWNSFIASIHLTPNATVNIGDTLCFHVYANVPAADIAAWNNDHSVCIPVVNSYDPNMKEVTPRGTGPEGFIPQNTAELTYTVHFQNTGNAPAFNVSILDTIDTDLDWESLRIIGASHAMIPEREDFNVVRFSFNNINLPDSNSNEPASHGFVTFAIKPETGLPIGTQIKNTGFIYFDFNPAIVTNTTLNTIAEPNGIANTMDNALVDVFPNPNDGKFYVSNQSVSANGYDIRVEDCLGRVIKAFHTGSSLQPIDASFISNGLYTVTIINAATGTRTIKKLLKQ